MQDFNQRSGSVTVSAGREMFLLSSYQAGPPVSTLFRVEMTVKHCSSHFCNAQFELHLLTLQTGGQLGHLVIAEFLFQQTELETHQTPGVES